MDGAAQMEALQAMAAARAAAAAADDDDDEEEEAAAAAVVGGGEGEGAGGEADAAAKDSSDAPTIDWLNGEELQALLSDARVRSAVEQIAAQPNAMAAYVHDAVVVGVLHSLCATHAHEVAAAASGAS